MNLLRIRMVFASAAFCWAVGLLATNATYAQQGAQSPKQQKLTTRKQAEDVVRQGYDAFKSKKYSEAVAAFTRALEAGKLRRTEMAKALYYRGLAHSAANQHAKAISDLTSALWLKGALNKADRERALAARSRAYKQAGLAVAGGSDGPSPARAKQAETKNATAASNPVTSGLQSLFGSSLFGGSSVTQTGSLPKQQTNAANASQSTAPSSTLSWSSVTKTSTNTAAVRHGAGASATGRYIVQVASLRSRRDAETVARRLAKDYQRLLKGRKPTIAERTFGNMGKFYVVRVGAYTTQREPALLCKTLLADGLDCLINAPG